MNAWTILAIVLAIGVIAIVGFIIPILIQIKDMLKVAERTVIRLEKDVEPVLQNFEGITHNVEGIIGAANDFVHRKPKTSNEPKLIDNVKSKVNSGIKTVKQDYIPEVKYTANKYIRATKAGVRTAINTYKNSAPVDSDKQLVVYKPIVKDNVFEPNLIETLIIK
ncbi:MAG: DUF948 domain-containing protein [Candidatus Sericytochromatia bacterium]